ncbi:MAG: hypothetical protein WCI27_01005 [Candidatus Omnitrophota bacterium]
MLSARDKEEMLADAASAERRESFRRLRMIQESRGMTLDEYCRFCESMARLVSFRRVFKRPATAIGARYLL